MPVIAGLFGGSCRDDLISFSALNTWDALDGLFPTSRKRPTREMRIPPFPSTRIRSEKTAGHHLFKADPQGLGVGDVKLKGKAAGVLLLRVCGEQRSPNGKEQRPSRGGETSPGGFCHRIPVPDDAEVEQARAAIRMGVLMITLPRKGMGNIDWDASHEQSRAQQL